MYSGERLLQLTGFQWQKTSRWDLKKMQRDSVWIDRVSHYIKKGSAICFQPRIWGLNTKNTELQRVHDGLNRDYNLIKILHRGKSCFDNDLRVQLVKWAAWECFVLAGVSTIRTRLQHVGLRANQVSFKVSSVIRAGFPTRDTRETTRSVCIILLLCEHMTGDKNM